MIFGKGYKGKRTEQLHIRVDIVDILASFTTSQKAMNIEHQPAMHHKRWWHDHCQRDETPGHSTKTTQRYCGQVERPTSNFE